MFNSKKYQGKHSASAGKAGTALTMPAKRHAPENIIIDSASRINNSTDGQLPYDNSVETAEAFANKVLAGTTQTDKEIIKSIHPEKGREIKKVNSTAERESDNSGIISSRNSIKDETEEEREARKVRIAEKKRKKKINIVRSTPFYVTLFAVTVIAWLLPLRPTVSMTEKRMLTEFPVYSTSDLLSGKYFSSIEDWFSDTFTFRDRWISVSQNFNQLRGIQSVVISGDVVQNDEVPVIDKDEPASSETDINGIEVLDPDTTEMPATSVDNEEQLVVEITPEIKISEVLENLNVDEDGVNQMDEEQLEEWKGLVIEADEYVNKASVMQVGSSTFEFPSFSRSATENYASILNSAGERLAGKANLYCIPVPATVSYSLTREDREKYDLVIEEDAIDYFSSLISQDNVKVVNAVSTLASHADEYLGFRTDPHWTARGAYYGYVAWCKVSGKEPVALSEYTEGVQSPFYGTYYYNNSVNRSLLTGDDVYTYTPPGDVHLYLNFSNNDRLGVENDLITQIVTNDKYLAFLSTDEAQATFINNDITDNSACVVYKTSFGNPFVYYLTQHYHTVYVMDIRFYSYRSIGRFIDANPEVQDVLIVTTFGSVQQTAGNQSLISMLLK